MKIAIIGAGNIGKALAKHFIELGHPVQISNSRGPDSLAPLERELGVRAVGIDEVAQGAELLILAIPMKSVQDLPPGVLRTLSASSTVVDTGNYIPMRDGAIPAIDAGMTESEWTASMLGRPVLKAFNNIVARSLVEGGMPPGSKGRLALSVAGDDQHGKTMLMGLIDQMGFDAVDAGPLSSSWRQQPGTPAYCPDYDRATLLQALGRADRTAAPTNRDAGMQRLLSMPAEEWPQGVIDISRGLWPDRPTA